MKEKVKFKDLYNSYKLSNDTIKIINGVKYFKIIDKEKVNNFEIIILPNEVFNKSGDILKDNKGNIFRLGNVLNYSFKGKVPRWYFETSHVILEDISIDKIGNYVTMINN